ncbi:MAG: AMP-binding protein [Solirubrobacteraceae bacterium]|jgi:O-succinylbenzoic acid--CoA ligase
MEVEAWLARAAATRPQQTALRTLREDWSYARLHDAARSAAAELAARGAGRGERVAIALPAGLEFARALHACLLLGAVAVPVDLRLSAAEQAHIAAGAVVVVDEPLGEERTPAGFPTAGGHDLDAAAVVIHTSGTTASPRPVELTYGNILWSALGSAVALGIDPQERWLCALPLAHVGGLSILLRSAIYGTTAVVHERFETEPVLHALQTGQATLVSVVATTLSRLLDAGLQRPPALRCALTGGGPVPAALVARAHDAGVPVSLTYGLTESCSQATTTPAAEIGHAPASAGPPLFCTRLRIAAAAPGTNWGTAGGSGSEHAVGEILVAGPTVAPAAVAADGWLHTGDLGELDEHGRLWVRGRMADTIVSGGENVAPAEVEAVLEAHPQVLEAAVVGRPDPQWGEAVSAIVVVRAGASADVDELRVHCVRALAPYKVPKRFELATEPLPRTRSGKLLRRELR